MRTEVQRPVGATAAPRARSAPTPQRPPRRTPPRGEAPTGSEPTEPDSEHQGRTSASEDNRRSEQAGEGRLSDLFLWRSVPFGSSARSIRSVYRPTPRAVAQAPHQHRLQARRAHQLEMGQVPGTTSLTHWGIVHRRTVPPRCPGHSDATFLRGSVRGLPNVQGRDRERVAGKRVMVTGAGHSAACWTSQDWTMPPRSSGPSAPQTSLASTAAESRTNSQHAGHSAPDCARWSTPDASKSSPRSPSPTSPARTR